MMTLRRAARESKKDPPNPGEVRKVCKKPAEVKKAPSKPGAANEKALRRQQDQEIPSPKPNKATKVPPRATGLSRKPKVKASAARMLGSTGKQKLGANLAVG